LVAIDADVADIAFDTDQPVRIELPVVARRQAERGADLVDFGPARMAAGHRGRRGAPLAAKRGAVVTPDLKACPTKGQWRRHGGSFCRQIGSECSMSEIGGSNNQSNRQTFH
jgi:hypothetical protein